MVLVVLAAPEVLAAPADQEVLEDLVVLAVLAAPEDLVVLAVLAAPEDQEILDNVLKYFLLELISIPR